MYVYIMIYFEWRCLSWICLMEVRHQVNGICRCGISLFWLYIHVMSASFPLCLRSTPLTITLSEWKRFYEQDVSYTQPFSAQLTGRANSCIIYHIVIFHDSYLMFLIFLLQIKTCTLRFFQFSCFNFEVFQFTTHIPFYIFQVLISMFHHSYLIFHCSHTVIFIYFSTFHNKMTVPQTTLSCFTAST